MPPRHVFFRIIQSYWIDWIIAVGVALFANFYLDQFQHFPDFDLTDTSIQHSFVPKEVFPNSTLAYILVVCYVLLIVSNLVLSRNMWDMHHALLGLTVSFSIVGTFVEIVRITTGRPRPDFISRCNPLANATNPHFFGLANITGVCQTPITDPLIKDGMRSFFSGHACLSSAGLGYNSLYWAGKFQLFNHKSYTSKAWFVFAPLMVSIWICITRVTDHRHHVSDVAFGFFVGLLPTYVFYRQFYPALNDPNSGLPYPPRFPRDTPAGRAALARSWKPSTWFASDAAGDDIEGPTPLLPTNRGDRDAFGLQQMRSSQSNLGHGSVEADLEAGGLRTTPFEPDTGYSGLPMGRAVD